MKHISYHSWNKTTRKASNVLTLSFDFTNAYLWFYRLSPLLVLNDSFDFTELSSPQRNDSEPSLLQRRALAVSITSLRQLVESKGTLQYIHTCTSDNPLKQCTKSIAFVAMSSSSNFPNSSLQVLYLQAGLCKFSEIWHLYQLYFVFLHGIMLCILLLKYCRKPINDCRKGL